MTTTATRFVNFYELLQIPQTANADEVRQAIIKERRLWFKRQASADPTRRAEAEVRVRDIDQAEKVLLDPAARATFDRELAAYRPRPTAADSTDVDESNWLERARGHLLANNPGAANYAAREAINQDGRNHEAWFLRAHSSFLLGNGSDAQYEFTEAIRLRPDNAFYHYGFGEAYAAQAKWDAALAEYERALQLEPGNPEYLTSIAQIYIVKGPTSRALEIMEGVVKEHPDNAVFKYYLAIALHDSALDSLGKTRALIYEGRVLNPGAYTIISEAQADLIEKCANRIASLKVDHRDIVEMVAELRRMASDARTVSWDLSGPGGWFIAFVLFAVIPFLVGASQGSGVLVIGVFAGILLVSLFTHNRRLPGWERRRRELTNSARLERTGI